ncbi:MAG: hypothetical protein ABIO40_04115 [Devosia sp.]
MSARQTLGRALPRRRQRTGHTLPLIVSLTSHPPRFPTLLHTLHSLLQQRLRPDALELCVAEHEGSALPRAVLALRNDGLILRIADDLKSYKKYVPARAAWPDALIVTADDDAYYRPTWLAELVAAWTPHARTVLCHRAHRLVLDATGAPLPYAHWVRQIPDIGPDPLIFPTGVGGVLYPPGLHHADVLKPERFTALCPTSDDIWFYWMGMLAGASFRKIGPSRDSVFWSRSQRRGLWRHNVAGGNDGAVAAMLSAYGLPAALAARTAAAI